MASRIRIPDGYGAIEGDGVTLIGPQGDLAELEQAALHRLETWSGTSDGPGEVGRGAVTPLTLPSGRRLILKKMRRGGLAATIRNDRFTGTRRLLANLTLPVELAARGVATAEPAALLLREERANRFQAWLATSEIRGAVHALAWLESCRGTGPGLLDPVVGFVRTLHDAGLEHRDLNLSNLMVTPGGENAEPLAVLDLDGSRLHPGGLPFRLRMRSLWRMERSMVKRFGTGGPLGEGYRRAWADAYAAGDRSMAKRILGRWWIGRILLAVHRAGW